MLASLNILLLQLIVSLNVLLLQLLVSLNVLLLQFKTIKHLTNYSILKLVFSKSVFLVSVIVNQMRPSLSSHLSTQFSKFFFSSYFYWRCTPKLILREGIKLLHNNLEQSW